MTQMGQIGQRDIFGKSFVIVRIRGQSLKYAYTIRRRRTTSKKTNERRQLEYKTVENDSS
jgi:hypothetical protein